VNPENSYVQVLDSADSAYYGHVPRGLSNCSEYSCYSIAASRSHVIMDPRMIPESECSSFAIYSDSDNCSTAFGYSNNSVNHQRFQRVPAPIAAQNPSTGPHCQQLNVKQFGDTLLHPNRRINQVCCGSREHISGCQTSMSLRPDLYPIQVSAENLKFIRNPVQASASTTDS
jgi:hypothetical protein